MKNTALAELIHYIEHKGELHKETLLNKAKSLLEKEKQDLIDMYENGGENYATDGHLIHGEEVFNAEFKQ